MNTILKHTLSFFSGLIITAGLYFFIASVIYATTSSWAGENLTTAENRDTFYFYFTLFIIIATAYIVIKRIRTARKFSAIGIAMPMLFACFICFLIGQEYARNLFYRQPFDKQKWDRVDPKPFYMARTLLKDSALKGRSKQQIIEMLGTATGTWQNGSGEYLSYMTDKDYYWSLRLYFEKEKVIDAYLYLPAGD